MANYPEWVMKCKAKGTYINLSNGKYYLYAAHSERVAGTKKVKRICDAYLGRITEKDGLIPPKDKVTGSISVYEYGLSSVILSVCSNIHKGLRKSFTKNGDFVMIASILTFIYGSYNDVLFRHSYLSIRFPELNFSIPVTEAQIAGIDRGFRMINDTMSRIFNENLSDVRNYFALIYKVKINGKLYLSEEPAQIQELTQKFNLRLEEL